MSLQCTLQALLIFPYRKNTVQKNTNNTKNNTV